MLKDGKSGRIVGFQSFLFQDDQKYALQQALRIDPKLTGQGIGKKFGEL